MSDEFEELSTDLDKEIDEKSPSGGNINVFFQSTIGPSQKSEKMLVSLDAPVADLKYTISQLFSLDVSDFHLSHAGRTMDPDDTLGNYDVSEGDTILLIPVSIAGCINS
ncbi:MAG: ubiquitin-like domain-containing protein [Candidatus Kariarchaeaceae archaeon]|jgi:hypothetical protein